MLNERVEFSLGVAFLFVSFAGYSDSDSVRQVADSLRPDELIKFRVNSDIGCSQQFSDQFFDFFKSSWCLFLELGAMC